MNALTHEEATVVIRTVVDNGIDYVDHADIYGRGTSEEIFGKAFKELGSARDSVMLQTKCGITLSLAMPSSLKAFPKISSEVPLP